MVESGKGQTPDDILARIAELVSDVTGLAVNSFDGASTLESDLKLESVKFVELHVAIEDEFDIQIDPIEVVELNSLGAISRYVHSLIRESRLNQAS